MTPALFGANLIIAFPVLALLVVTTATGRAEPVVWAIGLGSLAIVQMLANVGGQIVRAITGEAP